MEQTTREAASSFRPYDHVERLGHSEVDGIDLGTCYVFPKIDGTNACAWWDGGLRCGSRNRECTVEADNQGFAAWANSDDPKAIALRNYLCSNRSIILYGEWLVPHTIKLYRPEAWRRFYVFDAFDRASGRYGYLVEDLLVVLGIDVVLPMCKITNPSKEQLLTMLETNTFLMQDGAGPGEGIVLKNYTWTNRFGRQPWAKIVRSAFKDSHVATMGVPEMKGQTVVELAIVNESVTPELVAKTRAKILVDVANHDNIDLTEPGAQRLLEETRRVPGKRSITVKAIADAAGISRKHLYNLIAGAQTASPGVESRLAAAMKRPVTDVRKALSVSRMLFCRTTTKAPRGKKVRR